MYVVHVITGLGSGGAETMLFRLLSESSNSSLRSRVVVLTKVDTLKPKIEGLGVPVELIAGRDGALGLLGMFIRLVRVLHRERPDVVQTWLYHADFFGLLASKLAGVRRVMWNLRCSNLKTGDVPTTTRALVWLLARLSAFPECVVVNSQAGLDAHVKLGYHPHRWALIPNGFDIHLFKPDLATRTTTRSLMGIDKDSLVVGLVGRWHPMKDHFNFMQAAQKLKQILPAAKFILVGKEMDSHNQGLREILRELHMENEVNLLGERSDVAKLTLVFDLAVSASYSEGFPTTIGEAMASGIPCVATDVGDSRILIGDTGIVVPPRNPELLAMAMAKVLLMPNEGRRALGNAARMRICNEYSIKSVALAYAKLYETDCGAIS